MQKAVLYIAISLDGFVARKNDDLSWLDKFNNVDYGFDKFFSTVGAIIQGKRTYEIEVKNGWENVHPVPTFVMSNHPPEREPQRKDVVFTSEPIEVVLQKARNITNKNIWIEGGAAIAQQFIDKGLARHIYI
jgi:dihydrofolate reductase